MNVNCKEQEHVQIDLNIEIRANCKLRSIQTELMREIRKMRKEGTVKYSATIAGSDGLRKIKSRPGIDRQND